MGPSIVAFISVIGVCTWRVRADNHTLPLNSDPDIASASASFHTSLPAPVPGSSLIPASVPPLLPAPEQASRSQYKAPELAPWTQAYENDVPDNKSKSQGLSFSAPDTEPLLPDTEPLLPDTALLLPGDNSRPSLIEDTNNCTATGLRLAGMSDLITSDNILSCTIDMHIDIVAIIKLGTSTPDCDDECKEKITKDLGWCNASCQVDGKDVPIPDSVPEDECENESNKCDLATTQCVNTPTSYVCKCKDGLVPVFDM